MNNNPPLSINSSQKHCINKTIGGAINHLLYGKNDSNKSLKTMVLPLAIPTGFGKTRIAIRGIFNTKSRKTGKFIQGTVVLWPQKGSHLREMWIDPNNWDDRCKERSLEEKKMGFEYAKNKYIAWSRLKSTDEFITYNKKRLFYVLDKDIEAESKSSKLNKRFGNGPIFFIIDEWHGKKLIEKFQKYESKITDLEKRAEEFWRKKLLPSKLKEKKLFVLLVSATPIATTENMDENKISKLSNNNDKDFQQYIKTAYESFQILTKVGYKSNNFNILDNNYNLLINHEVKKLRFQKNVFEKNKKKFATQYAKYLQKMSKELNATDIYLKEQKKFASDPDNHKLKTFLKFINNDKNKKKKFVVFCHYLTDVAEKLEEFLCGKVKNGYAFYDGHIYKKGSEQKVSCSKAKKLFNDKDKPLRILIVTDKDSQGIDLHKSKADIIHYELSWNPIRIIQRFGRVWRIIDYGKKAKMTKPHAYHMPYTYSSEEEQLNRLDRRWKFLEKIDADLAGEKKKKIRSSMRFTPISMEIALGDRLTPEP
ncbi:C-terminal helicase domain-containing protein [uncultured Fibrobacter sp.]|uniref:C-terminal helicase domain-containing protein n=1 Tax=uncultured Fibrobacter sp. TaxID=261512 RepID=UPI0025FF1E6F|nr:C-terminal helicase domain-containing protein [uncultured Fibrobacter sp.]